MSGTITQEIDQIIDAGMARPNGRSQAPLNEGNQKPSGEPQPGNNSDNNSEHRIKKHIQERDTARTENSQLKQQLAQMQGQLDTFSKFVKPEPEADPTEDMTDTEAAMFKTIQNLESQIKEIGGAVNGVQQVALKNDYRNREQTFWANNPNISSDDAQVEARELVRDYSKENPSAAQELLKGNISLQNFYDMALMKSGNVVVNKAAQDSTKVFGDGRTESTAPRSEYAEPDAFDTAKVELKDKNSVNKKEAVTVGIKAIADEIVSSMDV